MPSSWMTPAWANMVVAVPWHGLSADLCLKPFFCREAQRFLATRRRARHDADDRRERMLEEAVWHHLDRVADRVIIRAPDDASYVLFEFHLDQDHEALAETFRRALYWDLRPDDKRASRLRHPVLTTAWPELEPHVARLKREHGRAMTDVVGPLETAVRELRVFQQRRHITMASLARLCGLAGVPWSRRLLVPFIMAVHLLYWGVKGLRRVAAHLLVGVSACVDGAAWFSASLILSVLMTVLVMVFVVGLPVTLLCDTYRALYRLCNFVWHLTARLRTAVASFVTDTLAQASSPPV